MATRDGPMLQHGLRWTGCRVEMRGEHASRLQLYICSGEPASKLVPRASSSSKRHHVPFPVNDLFRYCKVGHQTQRCQSSSSQGEGASLHARRDGSTPRALIAP